MSNSIMFISVLNCQTRLYNTRLLKDETKICCICLKIAQSNSACMNDYYKPIHQIVIETQAVKLTKRNLSFENGDNTIITDTK